MFETSEERVKWLKKGMILPVMEQLYLQSNGIVIIRGNICKECKKTNENI